MSEKKSKRARGRPPKSGLISRPCAVHSEELPDDLLDALDLAMRLGLLAMDDSLKGAPDGKRAMVRRRALSLLGKIQDSAIMAESSQLASWTDCKELDTAPMDPSGSALWLAAFAIRTLVKLELGQIVCKDEIAAYNVALRDALATIAANPVHARVEAARQLREERAIERERPGPTTTTTRPEIVALRTN